MRFIKLSPIIIEINIEDLIDDGKKLKKIVTIKTLNSLSVFTCDIKTIEVDKGSAEN